MVSPPVESDGQSAPAIISPARGGRHDEGAQPAAGILLTRRYRSLSFRTAQSCREKVTHDLYHPMTAVPGHADADAQGVRMRGAVMRAGAAAPVIAVAILGVAVIMPAGHGADRLAFRLAAAIRIAARHEAAAARGRPFRGTPAVGALFTTSGGQLADHFCTASVVHSRGGDLLITAAHCLTGRPIGRGGIVFVPAFHDGEAPYGAWRITAVFVDSAWSSRHDPDDDVAFLQAGRPGSQIEQATGAERLGIGLPPP